MSKEEKMFALIEEFEDSSLNGREFCKEKGLLPSTFYYWKKKKAQEETSVSGGFVAIHPKSEITGNLELIYPNGVRLRLDTSQLPLISKLLKLY